MPESGRSLPPHPAAGLGSDHIGAPVVVPGHQFVDLALRVAADDTGDDAGDVGLGIDVVELGGLDQRVDGCDPVPAGVGSREGQVRPADGELR
jgi:hypothetical protein